jgi:hypothetical protein
MLPPPAGRPSSSASGRCAGRPAGRRRSSASRCAKAVLSRRGSPPAALLPKAPTDWLDEHDLRRPLTRAELYSPNDDTAARIVAAGGGIEAVVEATGLRSRENVLGLIDPAILVRAFANDAATPAAAEPDRDRLRRLVPDRELVRRRAQGETLRRLACDYGVAHTTLSRWFKRPVVAKQLKQASRQPRAQPPTAAVGQAARQR